MVYILQNFQGKACTVQQNYCVCKENFCGLANILYVCFTGQVLLITLTLALPSFLRFAVCMIILFLAFVFCGWVVIGPYNLRVCIYAT